MPDIVRIAMWSGPRNISTAMLRAWGNRADTRVVDEPLYAHYLRETNLDHPGRDEIIANHEADWKRVVADLTGPLPQGKHIYYQKHMAHHLLPNIGRDWLADVHNCFLIREPQEMLTSLIKVMPNATLEDTGLPQQLEIARFLQARGLPAPPVIDSRDVLENPRAMLHKLCDAVGVDFSDDMLSWPQGPRDTDGIWAKHWYSAVEKSTGFQPYQPKRETVPDQLRGLLDSCHECYEKLYEQRLR